MAEINLLSKYPKRNRDLSDRMKEKSPETIRIAKKFGWEYFDKKGICYGGYTYDGRWIPVVKDFINHYNLKENSTVLDIGCAKGYMVYDFMNEEIEAFGIDISNYAIGCSPPGIRDRLVVCNITNLEWVTDKKFDLVISINTIHNLPEEECRKVVREIQRIGKNAFIMVDSYRNEKEKEAMFAWNVVGETVLSSEEWKRLFEEEGYTGDHFWFTP